VTDLAVQPLSSSGGPRRLRQTVARVAACAATLGMLGAACAQSPAAQDPAQELRNWLGRIHDAATRINYVGTLVDTADGTVSSSRVLHYCEGRNQLVRIDALDGDARAVLRINDEMRTIWPHSRVAMIEPVDPRPSFPALVTGSEQHVPDSYELHREAPDRVAGHDADRLLLKARDALRFDHEIWIDRATGLLLRVDVQLEGRTLESSAFSDVKIGVRPQPGAITTELRRLEGYRILKPSLNPTRLEDEGWIVRADALPAGFQGLGCVRRALPAVTASATPPTLLQAMFSDGLTAVSLFIEPYQPPRQKMPGLTVIGATHTLSRQKDEFWLTAVGDVPPATLEMLMRALDRRR